MKNGQTEEEIRDVLRSLVKPETSGDIDKLFDTLGISNITLIDLISGPDESLGQNQVDLREYYIRSVINGVRHISITFGKDADSKTLDELAKSTLEVFLAPTIQDKDKENL